MAARRRLTKRIVEAVEPGLIVWDTKVKGFGVRQQRRDHVYIVKARTKGRARWFLDEHAAQNEETLGYESDQCNIRIPPAISVIPGMRSAEAVRDNIANMATETAPAVWDELISDGLLHLPGRQKGSVPTPDIRNDLATSGNPGPGRSPTTIPSARITPGG